MLRWIVLLFGFMLLLFGFAVKGGLGFSEGPENSARVPFLIAGAVLVICVLGERWRYRRRPPSGKHWQPTGERFEDPETGLTMEVLYDPQSGERHYQPVRQPPEQ